MVAETPLQRARKTVDQALPERSQQATLRSLGDDGLRGLVERYVAAWESRNVQAMVAVLVEDATFAMPSFPCWFAGREDVVAFVSQFTPVLRHVVVSAGGQVGIAWYILHAERNVYLPAAIEVLALEGDRVREITAFADSAALYPRFGLPGELPG
ncbi:MAG: nuclear transport factor 2 family protein [Gaiella sp.]|nr:nuclear transport factor 2 family protein [Gaiella sp.]